MTRDVTSVRPEATYREVVDALVDHRVSAVPVVDAQDRVLGVVSEADLLHKVEAVGAGRPRTLRWRARIAAAKAEAATAAQLMTAPAVTVEPNARIADAARRLEARRVKRMPVVDARGRIVGFVSRRDLLRMHTRSDADVRADIVENVLRHGLWIDPVTVEVDVVDGLVTETGKVETRSPVDTASARTTRSDPRSRARPGSRRSPSS